MFVLIIFAFLAGIVTILSPCVLPVLPIVLSGTVGGGKRKPFGIVIGFILSFTFFTLALSSIVHSAGISADALRTVSVIVISFFGLSLILPQFQILVERFFSRFANLTSGKSDMNAGVWSGVLTGFSLGLIWTPCVGPILASVITLAASSSVSFATFLITFAYAFGTAIPMFFIMFSGRLLFQKVPWLLPNSAKIQKIFGVLMVVTAVGIFFNFDRQFQTYVLHAFPQYGSGLTKIETNQLVTNALDHLNQNPSRLQNEDQYPLAPEFIPGGEWINTPPLTLQNLKGKVVLVDFWTYTCINCIRTLPYTKAWYEKYKDQGFVLVGVHSPEFEFEKNVDNVKKAVKDFGITYPVMQDNNFATWKAYNNRYWPAEYLIDAQGRVRHTHFGEGEYDETEKAIQELLEEAGKTVNSSMVSGSEQTPTGPQSPETYLGSGRMEYYYPSQKLPVGSKNFVLSGSLPEDTFDLGGSWRIEKEHSVTAVGSSIEYNFSANKVFLVLRPGMSGGQGKVRIMIDGKKVDGTNQGSDVIDGTVTVNNDKLYNLIDLKNKSGRHILHLDFDTSGIEVFAFTFG